MRRDSGDTARLHRLADALAGSKSIDEALLKNLVHYRFGSTKEAFRVLSSNSTVAAKNACNKMREFRDSRIEQCRREMVSQIQKANRMMTDLRKKEHVEFDKEPFSRWLTGVLSDSGDGKIGDNEAAEWLQEK